MVVGVTDGFSKELKMIGVGYRAEIKGKLVVFALGVSFAGVVAYIGHQMGADGYEARQLDRHTTVMAALAAQTEALATQTLELAAHRRALYRLIDTVAEHHPEAAKVGKDLERGTVRR